jgi:hypothetical protein
MSNLVLTLQLSLSVFSFEVVGQERILIIREDALPLDKPEVTLDLILVAHDTMHV